MKPTIAISFMQRRVHTVTWCT